MKILSKNMFTVVGTGLCVLILITACAEWNSVPVVVDQQFGQAVNHMVKNQILYPEHGQNDKTILSMDGQKIQGVVQDYRASSSDKLNKAKQPTYLPVQTQGGI